MVTTVIPDDDRCETTLRQAAELMCQGKAVLVLPVPPLVTDDVMRDRLIPQFEEMLRDAAGERKHLLSRSLVSAHLGVS